MVGNLSSLGLPSQRLAEYLKYLGLSYKELEAHYGIGHSTWQVAATTGKKASSIIVDALSSKAPPTGKQPPSIPWLVNGDGQMLAPIAGQDLWEGSISREVFDAIQRAVQMLEDYVAAIPPDLRPRIDKRQKGYVAAQLVDELVGGHLEEIPKILGNFLAGVRTGGSPTVERGG